MNLYDKAAKLCFILNKYGYEAYFVGGCVRDMLLNNEPHDIDITTNATPNEIKKVFEKENISYFNLGEKFGTIVPLYRGEMFEITTYRTEQEYSDGRHPDAVKFTTSLTKDLARRDFTINAIAMNPNDKMIIDPFGGVQDIKNKTIKAVGNANDRFTEDGLRILRAIRFAIRYDFNIDEETGKAIIANKDKLKNVSKERITDEFRKIFSYNKPVKKIFNQYSEIIFEIFPEMRVLKGCEQNNKYHYHDVWEHSLSVVDGIHNNNFILNLAGLFHDIGKYETKTTANDGMDHFFGHPVISAKIVESMCLPTPNNLHKRLILSSDEYNRLYDLVLKHDFNFALNKKQIKRCLAEYGEDFLLQWKQLSNADFNDHIIPKDITDEKLSNWHTSDEKMYELLKEIHKANSALSIKDLALKGNDLIELGIEKGPQIGIILKDIFNKVLDEKINNTKEDLTEYIVNNYIKDKIDDIEIDI